MSCRQSKKTNKNCYDKSLKNVAADEQLLKPVR